MGITTEGLVMGTPYYMSPEQVRGASLIDVRTDVYALGVILYECSSGARPYDARSIEALAVFIHEGNAVPLAERRPSLPPDFCAVVHRAMAKDRDQRYPSARALGEALSPFRARITRGSPIGPPAPRLVVRPSTRPPPATTNPQAPMSSVVPSTDAALAATMGGSTSERRARRIRVAWLAGGASLLLGAVGAAVILRLAGAPRGAASVTANTNAGSIAHPPAVELTPLPVATPAPSATAAPIRPAGAAATASSEPMRVVVATTTTLPVARVDASAPTPASTGTGKSRVDQTGLAGENPFR
jgi:serine/threonine-protein kinase